jgi:chromosome segregation ATPase
VKAAIAPPARDPESRRDFDDDDDFSSLIEIRTRIESLLDEQETRASENESNLSELRLILENLNTDFTEAPDPDDVEESSKSIAEVQTGQEKLQQSISLLVRGAAQLFLQKNRVKVEKLRAEISDMTYMTTQIDGQIKVKNALLEERLNSSSKIDATNSTLRRRVESTKNEIRAIAGQDFENIPELARTYQETMKRILAEEVELTKQLWNVQQQLEKEKKEQTQLAAMYQKVKDHPIRMAQLQEELDGKLSVLRNELFEKEKLASQQRGQLATTYQNETQRLVIQARKEREEQLFTLKTAQLHQLIQAEKQAQEEKMGMINQAASGLSSNRAFKAKMASFDRETKGLMESYEQQIKKLQVEFAQAERRMKREHEAKIQAAEEKARVEKRALESEVQVMETTLAAKDAQYEHSSRKLETLQGQLIQLKERIARYDISNQQLEKAIGGSTLECDELMNLLKENKRNKIEEKNAVKRKLMDVISSIAYFMVLSGESEGDWMKEATECYEEALKECEAEGTTVKHVPVPFRRDRAGAVELLTAAGGKKRKRRASS